MAGSEPFIAKCPKCKHDNVLRGKALTQALSCAKCDVYFCVGSKNQDSFLRPQKPVLPLGKKGNIDGVLYEVMGFVVKREKRYQYYWSEYLLFNPYHGIAFLSESNGNWNFIKPNPNHPWLTRVSGDPETEEGTFKLYARFSAEVTYAQGEFFTDVIDNTETSHYFEYINPPYLLSYEQSATANASYKGKYITKSTVAKAFGLQLGALPSKVGMGYTQPLRFTVNEASLILATFVTLVATFLIMAFINNGALNETVWQGNFDQASLNDQKMFVTPSFELKGGTKDLVVEMFAPVSNDWFFAEYSLINETTGDELVFTSEVEYYYGVEDGYAWTEGSQSGEAFISAVPEGRYHINIYPEFSLFNHRFSITVRHDVPFYSNLGVMIFVLLVFPVCYYIYKANREMKRWEDSDYSPYSTE